jgi:hypothetical protein
MSRLHFAAAAFDEIDRFTIIQIQSKNREQNGATFARFAKDPIVGIPITSVHF